MKVFRCQHCANLVFFENTQCVHCQFLLAYLPDLGEMGALQLAESGAAGEQLWALADSSHQRWQLCTNYTHENICNWAVPVADTTLPLDPKPLCRSCELTRVIPDLSISGNKEAWCRLETAKRRLLYTLDSLHLPVASKEADPAAGLAFEFLADADPAGPPVLSGHQEGIITLNIAEADDAERERRRHDLGEPYRTILGHFRHEIGHYYWDRLLRDSDRLAEFRSLFGDETRDYAAALAEYYRQGPPPDWQSHFVTAYATAHPWEDWAETWAHYLHLRDVIETAADAGLSLRPSNRDLPSVTLPPAEKARRASFDKLIDAWFPLTYVINNLNRGLGLPDGYPFVLSPDAVTKLRFVHEIVTSQPSPMLAA